MVSLHPLVAQVRFFYSDASFLIAMLMLPAEAPQCISLCSPVEDSIMAACG